MNADDDIAKRVQPITISSVNCVAVTGMSWSWVTRFARAHDVPVWRVGSRKQIIPAQPLAAAMQAAATAPSDEDSYRQAERIVAEKIRRYELGRSGSNRPR